MDHDFRAEDSADGTRTRMKCKCGKRSRWSSTAARMRAQDRHADETAKQGDN